jgi:hypothetical protein
MTITKKEDINKKESSKAKIQQLRERDSKPVRGKFIFHEVPGGCLPFNYKAYEQDKIERYELHDGQIYTIPYGVAKHLNTNCAYPIYEFLPGEKGEVMQGLLVDPVSGNAQNMRIGRRVRRCSFMSLEFTEFDAIPSAESKVLSVERA